MKKYLVVSVNADTTCHFDIKKYSIEIFISSNHKPGIKESSTGKPGFFFNFNPVNP